MQKKPTDELMSQLTQNADLDKYIKENEESFVNEPLSDILNKIAKEKRIVKSKALKRAEINEIYGYQIFSGKRIPSRDKLIALCIGMELDLEETQTVLKCSGFARLYPKSKRDSIIISGIEKGQSVFEINGLLYEYNEDLIE